MCSYAGVDADIKFLNITKADEWELVWDLFEAQIEPYAGACRRALVHTRWLARACGGAHYRATYDGCGFRDAGRSLL